MMNDQDFLTHFESCTLPKELFNHYGHLRAAWLYLSWHSEREAAHLIKTGIKRYATSLGAAHIFHETITLAFIQLVHLSMKQNPSATFEEFVKKSPELFDIKILETHYSPSVLKSPEAKARWIEPDRKTLK
jgi:hypothetical protein